MPKNLLKYAFWQYVTNPKWKQWKTVKIGCPLNSKLDFFYWIIKSTGGFLEMHKKALWWKLEIRKHFGLKWTGLQRLGNFAIFDTLSILIQNVLWPLVFIKVLFLTIPWWTFWSDQKNQVLNLVDTLFSPFFTVSIFGLLHNV